jgi:dTDP-4-dehydrorhamnose reductase
MSIPISDRMPPFVYPYGAEVIDHQKFIKLIATYYKPKLYIEYGVFSGNNIAGIAPLCERCIGVDIIDKPLSLNNIENITYVKGKTRDFGKYIKESNLQYELAFIDADHSSNEAYNDFVDLFENLMDNGIIFLHDTYPTVQELTIPSYCNDSYKVPEMIRKNYSERADILTIPVCPGLTMIRKRKYLPWMLNEPLKTWILNLDKHKDRRAYMENSLKNTGLDYSFFNAVYGNNLKFNRTDSHIIAEGGGMIFVNPAKFTYRELTNGQIGASVSHRLLYKQLLEDKLHDRYLILEDDTSVKDIEKFWKYISNLPPSTEYDIAHFEISRNYLTYKEIPFNEYYHTCINTIESFRIGAFGYIVTKRGAMNILKKYGFTILGAPDDFLNTFFHDGGVFIEPKERFIEARMDIPSTIWDDIENRKKIPESKSDLTVVNVNRVVIFGSSGMLGRYMYKFFSSRYPVLEVNRDILDIGNTSIENTLKFLNENIAKDDLVINCAGVINKRTDLSENEMIRVNSVFPYLLSQVVSEKLAWMVQPTTDCVFSGNKGVYDVSDVKDDKDPYGITKSMGESVNKSRCSVIRCSIIGEELVNTRSLIEWAKGQRGNKVRGYVNHKWNGITCLQYAKEISNMIRLGFPKILQLESFWVDDGGIKCDYITKYDLLRLINSVYELNLEIESYETSIPVDRRLIGTQVDTSLNEQLKEMKLFRLS